LSLREQVERLLVCPRCHTPFDIVDDELRCRNAACGFVGALAHDVVALGDRSQISFFDDKHQVMAEGNEGEGSQCICYERQAGVVEMSLRPGAIVVDVGCGPTLPYEKPSDAFVIGLEASYESIRVNDKVDMRIYGTAAELPFPDHSLDTVLAFYAVHHMTGQNIGENRQTVLRVFREFGRVIKPGGELMVFEVSPWPPFAVVEKAIWNTARSILGRKLDMFFYSARAYQALGRATLPGAEFSMRRFQAPITAMVAPVFSLPWLQIPSALYPMSANLYRWRL
jgi:ubiquinone/menaquinone biosynthesis C-methylase UbiE